MEKNKPIRIIMYKYFIYNNKFSKLYKPWHILEVGNEDWFDYVLTKRFDYAIKSILGNDDIIM